MSQPSPHSLGQFAAPEDDPVVVTAADVAAWLRARTQDDQGREVGIFNEATRPTALQVQTAIEQARVLVAMDVGWVPPSACVPGYITTVALAAACIVEKSYFPEQIESRRSAYNELNAELTAALAGLRNCVSNGGAGPADAGSGAYSICTPRAPLCEYGEGVFVPANWNNPYAEDVDDSATPSYAQQWLERHQATWAGEPVPPEEPTP